MRGVLMSLVCMAMCMMMMESVSQAQSVAGPSVTLTAAAPLPATATVQSAVNADGEMANAMGQRRLSLRERRELGITWANVHAKAKELYQSGEIDADMSRAEIAAMVFSQIAADNPQAFADASVDWDAIIAFIEAILPLILQIIGLFS